MKNLAQPTLLFIGSDAVFTAELLHMLEDDGYHTAGVATTGRRALDLFQQRHVDLLICEIHLKGDWDGIETVRQLTAIRPVPVIYVSATSDRDTLERAKLMRPAAYLCQPCPPAVLHTTIELAIHNAAPRNPPVSNALLPKDPNNRESLLLSSNYLYIRQQQQFTRIDLRDLLYLEADNTHTRLITRQRKYILRLTLSTILSRIDQPWLVRTHRSYAVNVNAIDSFSDADIQMGSLRLPVSRSCRGEFMRNFHSR